MTQPQAYDPQPGQRFQILCKSTERVWEHCDYAKDSQEKNYLLGEYRLAYGPGFMFKVIQLPKHYWN